MATEVKSAEDLAAERKEAANKAAQAKCDADNAERTGKGTRLTYGWTRGKNSQLFYYEEFDRKQPATCPATLDEFMSVTKISDEAQVVGFLLDGWNADSLSNSSDPVNEFVDNAWSEDAQKQFKLAVKNYAQFANVSIEVAANLLKSAQKG